MSYYISDMAVFVKEIQIQLIKEISYWAVEDRNKNLELVKINKIQQTDFNLIFKEMEKKILKHIIKHQVDSAWRRC